MSSSRELNAKPASRRAGGFGRAKGVSRGLDLLLGLVLACVVLGAGGLYVWRSASIAALHARIAVDWRRAQTPLVARLRQGHPLQYGDVWATHTGLICGFVNGWGSFGGLSAMTPFYVWKDKPFFALDMTALSFAPGWRECLGDHWTDLVKDGKPVVPR
ncbi:MAG: hypothetical protein ACYDD1_22530 [Caulobacteraceae bacterium]